ncbi:hypothetical protein CGI18_05275 [Vibrio parahaemolyticus]|nr:hypothetical protein CGK58_03270 [Vibrio parahaemolyticus]TOD52698.1 hypothetical protein CGJ63_09600 [Vibrio parahaemolyticus]TOD79189.1 hypothetical protein CGJ58_16125 [Vibrio parahaemolyticus]TOK49139.1 hypothetical protein CGI18_05275 [Vibrio parahaemolyticus]
MRNFLHFNQSFSAKKGEWLFKREKPQELPTKYGLLTRFTLLI